MPPRTALDLEAAGARFFHANGLPRLRVPRDLLPAVEAEVAWRVAAMRGKVPASGPVPVFEIAPRPAAVPRAGRCSCCFDPQRPWVGGMCPLCVAALRRVLVELGRIPAEVVPARPVAGGEPAWEASFSGEENDRAGETGVDDGPSNG